MVELEPKLQMLADSRAAFGRIHWSTVWNVAILGNLADPSNVRFRLCKRRKLHTCLSFEDVPFNID